MTEWILRRIKCWCEDRMSCKSTEKLHFLEVLFNICAFFWTKAQVVSSFMVNWFDMKNSKFFLSRLVDCQATAQIDGNLKIILTSCWALFVTAYLRFTREAIWNSMGEVTIIAAIKCVSLPLESQWDCFSLWKRQIFFF